MTNDSLAQTENSYRWEYTTIAVSTNNWIGALSFNGDDFNAKLNELGSEGWEMASSVALQESGFTRQLIVVFKRPL